MFNKYLIENSVQDYSKSIHQLNYYTCMHAHIQNITKSSGRSCTNSIVRARRSGCNQWKAGCNSQEGRDRQKTSRATGGVSQEKRPVGK